MDTLTIHIDRKTFRSIENGKQRVLKRFVYPANASRYVVQKMMSENGEEVLDVTPKGYDALRLVNGYAKDAETIVAEVADSKFYILTDENGEDITFEENGEEYYMCQVWYELGNVSKQ